MSIEAIPMIYAFATNIALYIFGGIFGFLFLVMIVLLLLKSFKRKSQKSGQAIEEAIDPKITIRILNRLTQNAYREERYQAAVIYLYYEFRIYCEEKLTIRQARKLSFENLVSLVAGTPEVSLNDVKKFSDIYNTARNTNDDIDKEMCDIVKQLIRNITENNQ